MRIAIITQPLRFNYGGILQNFALQTILKRKGHEVVTLDVPTKSKKNLKSIIILLIRNIFYLLIDKDGNFLHLWKYTSKTQILHKNIKIFIDKYLNVKQFKKPLENEYDVLLVGSDQVWRPMYADLDKTFLLFAKKWKNIKRIAYAASFGTDVWEYTDSETSKYKILAAKFNAIAVRETSGISLCQKYLSVNAMHVLDPTMLLNANDYIEELNLNEIERSNGELFYYFLDVSDEKEIIVERFSKYFKFKSFTVNSKVEDNTASLLERIQPPVEKWLRAFLDAKFIITDSFHGAVFSILFNKPFIVLSNSKRGLSRFDSILNMFDQHFRLVDMANTDNMNVKVFLNKPNIDLSSFRIRSNTFLDNNL